ncbi:aspartic proteinase nepenthesin-1-like [Silene latifolia]|uniref:aspartic proteinase nepenthesin-1-like n=1 Tax=Silene latifolia TaxID=37657 RepID=UPI003D78A0A7
MLPQHLTTQEQHQFLTNISLSRVHVYSKNSTKIVENSITVPVNQVYTSYFVTPMTLGTEAGILHTYLALDTASPETWVQCEGCNPCIQVNRKDFSYTESPLYKKMSPYDPMCYPQVLYGGSCGFDITYGDNANNARTIGFVGRDVFYFQNAQNSDLLYPFPGIAFGCAVHNQNFRFGENDGPHNVIAGIHGLAPGPRSFLRQLTSQIRGQFSYCLVSSSMMHVNSYISFGDDAHISGDDATQVQSISMYREKYHLYLNGISVDGSRVPIDPSIFELDEELYTKGFFIDSGAPFTVLARSAYNPLEQAMINYFRHNYGWQPIDIGDQYPLCYSNFPSGNQRFPSMILHFAKGQSEEIDWIMHEDNLFLRHNDGFCVLIYVTDDPGPNLFGAFQQVNFNILYDVNNGLLSFVPKRCHEMTI